MSLRIFLTLPLLLILFNQAWCISLTAKKKYPYQLLTDDYGILNENDLAAYASRIKSVPFTGKELGRHYWQCFPRNHIAMTLEDFGYSSENFGWEDTIADLKITALVKPGIFHEYTMRAVMPVKIYEKNFHHWRNLMNGAKYVCLAGESGTREIKVGNDGVTREIYSWTFDRIKTKKGCDSYFDGDCKRIY